MEHIKKNWIWYLLGLIAVIILAMNWKKLFGKGIDQSKGRKPDPADCGERASSKETGDLFLEIPEIQCTRPKYDLSDIANADELCFTAYDIEDDYNLKKGDPVPSSMRIGYNNQPLKTWRLNRQSGNKYCYVYSPTGQYPLL